MRFIRALMAVLPALCAVAPLDAHRIDEYLQATLLSIEAGRAHASMRLVPGQLIAAEVVERIDTDHDGSLSAAEQHAYAQRVLDDLSIEVDGTVAPPRLLGWNFPSPQEMRDGLGEIQIEYAIALPRGGGEHRLSLVNRHRSDRSVYLVNALAPDDARTGIVDQRRDPRQSRYELDFRQDEGGVTGSTAPQAPAWWQGLGLSRLFELGMHHIAEGTDHLLFLLALLLPAPLLASPRRWGAPRAARSTLSRVLAIVTAFTIGHSITLMAAAVGGWSLPARPVEVLIAMSILVSSVHALRPIFPGREALVAAAFGLVHGLAFAATLDRLGLGLWPRLAGTLAFNLGIEAMQLLVIVAVLPSLLMMSQAPAYRWVRIGGALAAGMASIAWAIERLLDVDTRVDVLLDAVARQAPWLGVVLLLAAFGCRWRAGRKRSAAPIGCVASPARHVR